jgi:hypothetical protein
VGVRDVGHELSLLLQWPMWRSFLADTYLAQPQHLFPYAAKAVERALKRTDDGSAAAALAEPDPVDDAAAEHAPFSLRVRDGSLAAIVPPWVLYSVALVLPQLMQAGAAAASEWAAVDRSALLLHALALCACCDDARPAAADEVGRSGAGEADHRGRNEVGAALASSASSSSSPASSAAASRAAASPGQLVLPRAGFSHGLAEQTLPRAVFRDLRLALESALQQAVLPLRLGLGAALRLLDELPMLREDRLTLMLLSECRDAELRRERAKKQASKRATAH